MGGASGARFTLVTSTHRKTVIKEHRTRARGLIAQARFMQEHEDVFPRVFWLDHNGLYAMEHLDPLMLSREDREGDIFRRIIGLCQRLWEKPFMTLASNVMRDAHEDYVSARAGKYTDKLISWKRQLGWVSAVPNVHGDPTVENMMCRNGQLVAIDPLPADHRMPSVLSVDLGKMLQSAWGYETIKGRPLLTGSRTKLVNAVLGSFPVYDQQAATYFLAVHIVRLIPYQPAELQPIFWAMLDDVIKEYTT